jgi:hypothetical protein
LTFSTSPTRSWAGWRLAHAREGNCYRRALGRAGWPGTATWPLCCSPQRTREDEWSSHLLLRSTGKLPAWAVVWEFSGSAGQSYLSTPPPPPHAGFTTPGKIAGSGGDRPPLVSSMGSRNRGSRTPLGLPGIMDLPIFNSGSQMELH